MHTVSNIAPELNKTSGSLTGLHNNIHNYKGDLNGLNKLQNDLNTLENQRSHGAFGWKGEGRVFPSGQADLHRQLHLCYQEIRRKLESLGHREELEIHPKLMYIKNDLDACINCLNSCRSTTGDSSVTDFTKLRDVYRTQGILYHLETKRMNGMFVPPECLAYTPVKDVPEREVKGSFDPTQRGVTDEPAATKQRETLTLPVDVVRGQAVLHDMLFEAWELSYRMAWDLEQKCGFYGAEGRGVTRVPGKEGLVSERERGYLPHERKEGFATTEKPAAFGVGEKGAFKEERGAYPTQAYQQFPLAGEVSTTQLPGNVSLRELIVGNVSVCDLGLLANQLNDAIQCLREMRPTAQIIEKAIPVPSEPKVIEKIVPVPSEPKIIEKVVTVPSEPKIIEKTIPVPSEPRIIEKPVVVPSEPQIIEKPVVVPSEPQIIEKPVPVPMPMEPQEVTIPMQEVRTKMVTVPATEAGKYTQAQREAQLAGQPFDEETTGGMAGSTVTGGPAKTASTTEPSAAEYAKKLSKGATPGAA